MEPLIVDYNLVKKSEDRVTHDKKFLFLFGIILIILFGSMAYTLSYSESEFLPNIFDERCKIQNGTECSEQPVNKLEIFWITCVNLLIATIIFGSVFILLQVCPLTIIVAISTVAIFLCLLALYGIRNFYNRYSKDRQRSVEFISDVPFAFIVLFIIINIGLIVTSLRKFRLTGFMLQQTTKVLFCKQFRKLWILPIIEVFCIILTLCLSYFATSWMYSAVTNFHTTSTTDIIMNISILLNIFVTILVVHIISMFFYMTISGAVASWYFNYFDNGFPMGDALKTTIKHHLGSVVFGSFMIQLPSMLPLIICLICFIFYGRYELGNIYLLTAMAYPIRILLLIPRYAFIEIAIHGLSYWKALKSVGSLFCHNKLIFVSVNVLTDTLLLFILAVTSFIGMVLGYALGSGTHQSTQVVISILFITILFEILFSMFRSTIDCLVLCFCEHARIARRYSNVRELYQFIECAGCIKYKLPPTRLKTKPTVKKVTLP